MCNNDSLQSYRVIIKRPIAVLLKSATRRLAGYKPPHGDSWKNITIVNWPIVSEQASGINSMSERSLQPGYADPENKPWVQLSISRGIVTK